MQWSLYLSFLGEQSHQKNTTPDSNGIQTHTWAADFLQGWGVSFVNSDGGGPNFFQHGDLLNSAFEWEVMNFRA